MSLNLDLKTSLTLRLVAVALFCFLIAAVVALFGTYRDVRKVNADAADIFVRQLQIQLSRIESGIDVAARFPDFNLASEVLQNGASGDAEAYAKWAGKDLPTEAEFEFAARGGLDGAEFAWGDELTPGNRHMANTWQGTFPAENLALDGYKRTSPVMAFPPNGYGVYDMIGNVWEWTSDWYSPKHDADAQKACCIPENPRGGPKDASYDPCQPQIKIPRKVLKGGSHLCAPNYCRRYRPAARHAEPIDTSTSHVGFRCVARGKKPSL